MSDRVMLDSNIWIYAFMKGEDKRINIANTLIEKTESIILTTQVINEVCNVLLRKNKVSNTNISAYIDYFYDEYTVAILDEKTIKFAANLRISHNFSFWDSLIVSSAIENECTILYSEDMQHNLTVQNTCIINPFC
ncbi:PIN domain-containing protein [Candidatus Halobeggiatoa sp. HSG11]|nr:PIN domain-containing protein [Candidatus Halobeggiatoa sp. HSG11]